MDQRNEQNSKPHHDRNESARRISAQHCGDSAVVIRVDPLKVALESECSGSCRHLGTSSELHELLLEPE